jgi:copper oxidase (laccase) domain-containing protein
MERTMRVELARFERRGNALELKSDSIPAAFRAIVSLANAGNMGLGFPESTSNREAFYRDLGLDGARVLSLPLRHSKTVLALGKGEGRARLDELLITTAGASAGASAGADGLLLADRTWVGAVTVADCMPIWLLDRRTGSFGILHSGWKGTGILESAIGLMVESYGSIKEDLTIVLGPSIGSCCYKVSAERAKGFASEFGRESVKTRDGAEGPTWFLDLGAANMGIASRLNVCAVVDARICTACSTDLGSFRREGEGFTRMLALAGYI